MSDLFGPSEATITRALPSPQDNARNRVNLHFAVSEYEHAAEFYKTFMDLFLNRYMGDLPEMPHEELKQKIAGDILLAQEVLHSLSQRGDILVELARKLVGYIPSSNIVA
jgi:hypothetical protein